MIISFESLDSCELAGKRGSGDGSTLSDCSWVCGTDPGDGGGGTACSLFNFVFMFVLDIFEAFELCSDMLYIEEVKYSPSEFEDCAIDVLEPLGEPACSYLKPTSA